MSTGAVILIAALTGSVLLIACVCIAERLDPPPRDPDGPHPGPAGKHAARPCPDLDALTPGPAGGGWLDMLPADEPADITGVDPADITGHDVAYYLGMPSAQYVDELFDKHAEAQQ